MSTATVPSGLAAPAALLSLPALVLTMVFFTYYLKWTPSDWIFKGLLHYTTNDPASRTVNVAEPEPQSKKQAKKQEQKEKKNASYGGETLMIVPLTMQHIGNLSHTGEVDSLILFCMMLMVNGVVSFAVIHIFSLPDNKMWIAFALLLLGMSVSALMQATVFYESVGRRDKVYMAAFGGLATFLTSFGLTSDVGKRLLAFDITAASVEGAQRLQLVIDEIHSRSMAGTPPPKLVSPAIFHIAITMTMIIMAAFLSGLLMLPGMKAARLIFQASSAHAWAERNCIDFKWYQMLLMRLVFILPGLTAMLWIVPMVEVLGIPLDLLVYIQPAAVLLTAAVFLAALRSLVQSHLNSGCLEWYRLKHEKLADDYKARLQGISGNVRWILQGTGRVGLELAAPTVLLLLLGLLLLTRSLPNTWAKDEIDQQPSALWRVLVGFPAWWLCLSWFSYSSMMMLFQRFGLVSSNRVYFE